MRECPALHIHTLTHHINNTHTPQRHIYTHNKHTRTQHTHISLYHSFTYKTPILTILTYMYNPTLFTNITQPQVPHASLLSLHIYIKHPLLQSHTSHTHFLPNYLVSNSNCIRRQRYKVCITQFLQEF